MKIEEAIKQSKFDDEVEKLAVNIIFTANWLSSSVNSLLKRNKLTLPQFNVLRILKGQYPNPASVMLIKERMVDKESNASRLVDKLVAAGFVSRKQCPEDRRQVNVELTEKGMTLLDELNPVVKKQIRDYMCVTDSEAEHLNGLLDEIRSKGQDLQ